MRYLWITNCAYAGEYGDYDEMCVAPLIDLYFCARTCEAGALVRMGRYWSYVLLDLPYVRVGVACHS